MSGEEEEEIETLVRLEEAMNRTGRITDRLCENQQEDLLRRAAAATVEKQGGYDLRNRNTQSTPANYPLMISSSGGYKYKPYGIGDVQSLVDKLPPV